MLRVSGSVSRFVALVLCLSILFGLLPPFTVGVQAVEQQDTRMLSTVTEETVTQNFAKLEAPVPVNEYIHLPDVQREDQGGVQRLIGLSGKIFVVNKIAHSSDPSKDRYFILDHTSPSVMGKVAATEVTLNKSVGTGNGALKGTAVMGADPDMALSFDKNTSVSGDTRHNIRPLGPYEEAGLNVYMGAFRTNKSGTNTNNGDYRDIFRVTGKTIADGSALRVELRFTERASFCVKPTNTPTNWFYLGLNTADINAKEVYYQWNENTSSNTYAVFFANTPYMVSSYFYRLLTDRVYVEDLYAAIEEAMGLLPMDSRYDPETYEAFLSCLDESMNLYTGYNGVAQGSEANAKASRKLVEAQALKLHSYISELRINASAEDGEAGKDIRYFNASLYKWDSVNVNTAVHSLNDGKTEDHGFYFHGSTGAVTVPAYNTWNNTQHAEVMNLYHGVSNVNVQSFGIYSGLAAEELTQATNPPFSNDILTVQGFWGQESIDNIVDVYNSVSVPFIYDPATGYYTLDSDKYGVYFQEEPADGSILSIADKPTVAYVSTAGFPDATNIEGKDGMRYFDAEARYCTGFQPFATMQYKTVLGFSSNVDLETDAPSVVEAYLLGGLAKDANAGEAYRYKYNNLGTMTWSVGMQLGVEFLMTEDGRVTTPDGSSREDAIFEFSGDDDVWVYIDDKLVLDLGGIHGEMEGIINFATGDVTVSSDKYNRAHDQNPNGYGQTAPAGVTYTITEIDATQGANLHHGSVQNTVVNGVDLGRGVIYQKNLYTEVMKQSVSDFAKDGSHTLKIFYMDRGKGKTNCMIKFNLTNTDVISVEKDVPAYYNGDTSKPISTSTMSYLNELDFGFTLTRDTAPVAYYPYSIFDENGNFVGSGETDRMGHFTLKNDQRAEFANLQFEGQKYLVTEDRLSGRWSTTQWTATSTTGESLSSIGTQSPVMDLQGGQYSSEMVSLVCTNVYAYNPVLVAEEQVVVMDYGKPIDIAVIDNAVYDGISDLVACEGRILSTTIPKEEEAYGYATISSDERSFRYTLSKLLDNPVHVTCAVEFYLDDMTLRRVDIPVTILPANIMYYETDFATDVFHTDAKTTGESKFNWTTQPAGQGQDQAQDSGEVGDIVYKPVIDKEVIPSNAFFVDFDGRGYDQRYSLDPLYSGFDFDGEQWATHYYAEPYPNTVDGTTLEFPYDAAYSIDQSTGLFTLKVGKGYSCTASDLTGQTKKMYGSEFYTARESGKDSKNILRYVYTNNDYFQIRFRTENCVFDPLESNMSRPRVCLRILCKASTGELTEEFLLLSYTLENGVYLTVSGKLPATVADKTIITFGVRFQYIRPMDALEESEVLIDYFYVGPEQGWADSVNRDYLYFAFDDSATSQMRYDTAQYGTTTDRFADFDVADGSLWATTHLGPNSNYDDRHTVDHTEDAIHIPVTHNPNNMAICGPRLMTTGLTGTFPVLGSAPVADTSILNFDLRDAEYIQIRFKIENCVWSESDAFRKIIFLFNYIDKDGNEVTTEKLNVAFDIQTEEYQIIRYKIPETSDLKKNGVTLTAFGMRFRSIIGKDETEGIVTIDDIFIGTEEAMLGLEQPGKNLFFDFNNSDEDKTRYTDIAYGGYNFDDPENRQWAMSYGNDNETGTSSGNSSATAYNAFSISNGVLKFNVSGAPLQNQTRIGTSKILSNALDTQKPGGYYPWHTNPERMPLQLPGAYADYIQVRFLVKDCENFTTSKPNIGAILYFLKSDGTMAYDICNSSSYTIKDQYQTVTFSTKDKLPEDSILMAVGIAFRYIRAISGCEDTAAVYMDYLYVGELEQSQPVADSIYISFDNSAEDRDRYASDTYSFLSPDDEEETHWWINTAKVESVDISNRDGVLLATAVPVLQEYDKDGAEEWPDIYLESTSVATSYGKDYLDYKPEHAEIYQIRFKMLNFTYGSTPSSSKINPYVKLQWQASNGTTSDASERVNIDANLLTSGKWCTVTLKIPEQNRNIHSIMGIRPYFGGLESLSPEQQGQLYIDYIYVGPDDRPDQVYGYDSHYNNDTTYSDGSSLFVEGSGVKTESNTEKYTEASFTFTGTGFDIISRTGVKQATIRLEVKNSKGAVVKSMTVNNKGELELYQIPIVSVQGLDHGTYTVTLWVNQAVDSGFAFLQRGGEFYFDAVRIYNPIHATRSVSDVQKLANLNYKLDREAFQRIKEIRNILLTKPEFDAVSDTVDGAVFVDVNSSNVYPDTGNVENPSNAYYTAEVETYNKIGPKNEVYLAPNQAVAFNLKVSTNTLVASLDIGAKTIDGSSGTLKIGILAMDANRQMTIETYQTVNISSSTSQYWELDLTGVQFKATDDGFYQPLYLVFYNTSAVKNNASASQSVISLTDVKLGFKSSPSGEMDQDSIGDSEIKKRNTEEAEAEAEIFFQVDGNTMPATRAFVLAVSRTETPVLDEGTRILHSLDLAADISLNYAVPKTDLEGYDSFYLECVLPVYTQQGHMEDETVRIEGREVGEFYYFTLQGLTAVQMNDSITAQLHMSASDKDFLSVTDVYSIADYAMAQLNKTQASDSLKTLCADLLVYGAKAQLYKDYRTDSLADEAMTEEHRAYLTDLDTVTFGTANGTLADLETPTVTWTGKSLDLTSKVGIKYILNLRAYTGELKDLSLHLSYTDMDGEAQQVILTDLSVYNGENHLYAFTFDGLLAAELRTVVSAQVYSGEEPVSVTLEYSPSAYGNNKTGALGILCKALFAYSDSAKAFFTE